jgi:hypothetical protein
MVFKSYSQFYFGIADLLNLKFLFQVIERYYYMTTYHNLRYWDSDCDHQQLYNDQSDNDCDHQQLYNDQSDNDCDHQQLYNDQSW